VLANDGVGARGIDNGDVGEKTRRVVAFDDAIGQGCFARDISVAKQVDD